MAVQWFYGATHAKLGPFSAKELRELKVQGRIQRTDMVWKEGVKNGLPAGEIRGLFGSIPAQVIVQEQADLPMLEAVLEEAVVLPDATNVSAAAEVQEQAVIVEGLELKAIPEDEEFRLRAANALLALQKPHAPIEAELETPTAKACAPVSEPKDLVAPGHHKPRGKPAAVQMRRAIAECGAIIVSQDADRVRFRKKCVQCGFEEACNSVMRLMPGVNRQSFFCPKCRKLVGLSIRGA